MHKDKRHQRNLSFSLHLDAALKDVALFEIIKQKRPVSVVSVVRDVVELVLFARIHFTCTWLI